MTTRRQVLYLSALPLAGVAGCSSKIEKPDDLTVKNPHEAYELRDLSSWTAGSAFERGATLVVDGALKFTSEASGTLPRIEGEFAGEDGQTDTITAKYAREKRWVTYEKRRTQEFEPGASVGFRLFYEPTERTAIRDATVFVRA